MIPAGIRNGVTLRSGNVQQEVGRAGRAGPYAESRPGSTVTPADETEARSGRKASTSARRAEDSQRARAVVFPDDHASRLITFPGDREVGTILVARTPPGIIDALFVG